MLLIFTKKKCEN